MDPLYSREITTSAFAPKPKPSNRGDLFVKLNEISQMQGVTEKSLSRYTFPPLRPAFIPNQSHYEAPAVPRSDHWDSNTQERVLCSVAPQKGSYVNANELSIGGDYLHNVNYILVGGRQNEIKLEIDYVWVYENGQEALQDCYTQDGC